MAVGIIAAQSIGEPGTQLTMRTFHIGGTAARHVEESEIKAKKQGVVKFTRMKVVRNDAGQHVVLTRNGEMLLLDPKGRELEKFDVPCGANLAITENQEVMPGTLLCQWDPHADAHPCRSRGQGPLRGHHRRRDHAAWRRTPAATSGKLITEYKGDMHPQIILEDESGQDRSRSTTCGKRPRSRSPRAAACRPARCWPRRPREVAGTQDITGGLPRVTEIFEARKPKDPAVIAEIDGTVEILERKAPRQADDRRPQRKRHRARAPRLARQALPRPPRQLRQGAATPWSTARWFRTTSSASPAKRKCRSTSPARSRTSTAASAWRSTTSTSRSSSRRCCGKSAWKRSATRPSCPVPSWTASSSAP